MIRVLLADDERLIRAALRVILDSNDEITVVAEADNGASAVELAREHTPDVVVIDIQMPGMDGLTATRELLALPVPPRVCVLTTFDLDGYVHTALQAGAAGFMLKDAPPEDLVRAVQVVHSGDAILAPAITRRLLSRFAGGDEARTARARELIATLTPREVDVLRLVAEGLSNAKIGERLEMTEATVKGHVSSVLSKLHAANRVQAALIAHDARLVSTAGN